MARILTQLSILSVAVHKDRDNRMHTFRLFLPRLPEAIIESETILTESGANSFFTSFLAR